MKALKWLDEHFEEFFLAVILALIFCVELLQVVFRNLPFADALTWPEEFCRFCWVWSVFLSLPYTIRKGGMLRVSVLADMLPRTLRRSVNVLADLVNAAVMALLFVNAVQVVGKIRASGEASAAMALPMWIVYSVMLAGFGLGALRGVQMAVIHLAQSGDGEIAVPKPAAEGTEAGEGAEGEGA